MPKVPRAVRRSRRREASLRLRIGGACCGPRPASGAKAAPVEQGPGCRGAATTRLHAAAPRLHPCPLPSPLWDTPVPEDQRVAAAWSAPFVLLVLDDSRQQQLEYSNAAASQLFGRGYLDLFGAAGHELVALEGQVRGRHAKQDSDVVSLLGRHGQPCRRHKHMCDGPHSPHAVPRSPRLTGRLRCASARSPSHAAPPSRAWCSRRAAGARRLRAMWRCSGWTAWRTHLWAPRCSSASGASRSQQQRSPSAALRPSTSRPSAPRSPSCHPAGMQIACDPRRSNGY